ncbi:MAG: hypothetical protein H8E26_09170 [FCB group bacterium]|nr:hypothetical protein [FCB group bacterium]MBL7028971.1 hypothetical protein [Candidatus Neomarinimicrobiota bacterium]MBL7121991.1 hypothetical protein [Candidatus Neomarinimicrobiota bacterium]
MKNRELKTIDEAEAMLIQNQRDSMLLSLLYVTRQLGEIEGIISTQSQPDEKLLKVQKDFERLYERMIEDAGIEQLPESDIGGIGRDAS